jgi:hypothetical protein
MAELATWLHCQMTNAEELNISEEDKLYSLYYSLM